MVYEIRVKGHLTADQWRDWFGGMAMENRPDGDTRLFGPVADQAALHGILNRIRDLGLTLVCLRAEELDAEPGSRTRIGSASRANP
jgi:hypothetical protein